MSDFFEAREQEYREALAAQQAQRRAENEKERARVKTESDAVYSALLDTFPQPETPATPTQPFVNEVRDKLPGVTRQQRERWAIEDYERRRAATVQAETQGNKPPPELAHLLGEDLDIDALTDDEDEYYDED